VRVADALALPGPHVDTAEDLALVTHMMNRAEVAG